MPAIITTKFRHENSVGFVDSITSDNLYLFLGKSDAWSTSLAITTDSAAPVPADTLVEENDARQNMMALKKVSASDASYIALRHSWTSGASYVAWDDADNDIFTKSFYIITDEFKVYKCIKAGSTTSTVKPTQTNVNPSQEADGYIWKYMFTVFTTDAAKFLTNNYLPVKTVVIPQGGTIDDLSADDESKYLFQVDCAANIGKIYRYVVTNGGTGYSNNPTVTVYGNGTGAAATATVGTGALSGVITAINVTGTSYGANYTNAYVIITDSTGNSATARAVLSPGSGHGTDPVRELGAYYAAVAVRLEYSEGSGDFIIDNSFRQIGLIKNPNNFSGGLSTATTRSALRQLRFTSHSGFVVGGYITGTTSGAIAYVDAYDSATGYLKYHQNDKTGYGSFQTLENVTGNTGGTGVIASSNGLINPEINRFSGNIVFLENRAPINRSASQIEEIKVIVEF